MGTDITHSSRRREDDKDIAEENKTPLKSTFGEKQRRETPTRITVLPSRQYNCLCSHARETKTNRAKNPALEV